MTLASYVFNARHVERLAKHCTPTFTPSEHVRLDLLRKVAETLKRHGWELTMVNEGTIRVRWRFMLKGTSRRVCRVVELIPV